MTIRKVIKWTLISIGIGLVLLPFLSYLLLVVSFSKFFPNESSSKQELIDNFIMKEKEILELKSYFNSIVPDEYSVYIEFKGSEEIDLWVFETSIENFYRKKVPLFQQWNINPYNYKEKTPITYDSTQYYVPRTESLVLVKQKLKWTDNTFKEIKKVMDNANCISISSGDPAEIGYARSGMGKYSYAIFDKSIPDSLKINYNDSCTYILYNDKVALVYGGGVLGPQCFPDK